MKYYKHLPKVLSDTLIICNGYLDNNTYTEGELPISTEQFKELALLAEEYQDDDFSYFHAAARFSEDYWSLWEELTVQTFEDQEAKYPLCENNTYETLLELRDSIEWKMSEGLS